MSAVVDSVAPTPKGRRPPQPPGHWLLGNLPDYQADIPAFVTRCARLYGPIARTRALWLPIYLVSDPALAETVLVTEHRNYYKNHYFWRRVRSIFGQGLLTSEGDFWRRQRKLAAPAFHQRHLETYARTMAQHTFEDVARWPLNKDFDLHQAFMALTSRIVGRALFDEDVGGDTHDVQEAMDALTGEIPVRMTAALRLPDWLPTAANRRWRHAVSRLDALVMRFIERQRRDPTERDTLLSMLMRARGDEGEAMTDAQLRDEVITLFLAGHETTALALSWACYLLATHPDTLRRLQVEVDNVLGDRSPTFSDIAQLPYTTAVVKETLRLYPPAYIIGRQTVDAITLGGYRIEKGAIVNVTTWAIHRDPRWYADADTFRPERWSAEFEAQLPRFAYLPFGGGPRICIGDRFAMMEAVLILAILCRQRDFTYTADHPPGLIASITLRPGGGVPVRMAARPSRTVG